MMKKGIKLLAVFFSGLTLCFSLLTFFNHKQPTQANALMADRKEIDILEMPTTYTECYITFDNAYGINASSASKLSTYNLTDSEPDNGKWTARAGGKFSRKISTKTVYLRISGATATTISVGTSDSNNQWSTQIVRTDNDCYTVLRFNGNAKNPYAKVSADGLSVSMVSTIEEASKCKFYTTAKTSKPNTSDDFVSFFTKYVSSLWDSEANEVTDLETLKIRWAKAYYQYFILSASEQEELLKPIEECDANMQAMLEVYNKIIDKYADEDIFEYFISFALTAEETAKKFNDDIDLYCNGGNNPILTGSKSVSWAWAQASKNYNHLHPLEQGNFKGGSLEGELFSIGFTSQKLDLNLDNIVPFTNYLTGGVDYIDSATYGVISHTSLVAPASLTFGNLTSTDDGELFTINFKQNDNRNISELRMKYSFNAEAANVKFILGFADESSVSYDAETMAFTDDGVLFDVSGKDLCSLSIISIPKEGTATAYSFSIYSIEVAGTVQFEQSEEILEMLAKYDYLYEKYGNNTSMNLDNFLSRDVTPLNAKNNIINEAETSTSWIVVAISLIGVTTIGAFFLYRKRKEN